MNYWLLKTEPETYSISDLERDKTTHWHGVRNYQARNFLRAMEVGDDVLLYHSSSDCIGAVGLAKVVKVAYPDPSQFDKKSEYFDPKATKLEPRWYCPEIKFMEKFRQVLELSRIRCLPGLDGIALLQRGSRLSVQPLTEKHFNVLCAAARDGSLEMVGRA